MPIGIAFSTLSLSEYKLTTEILQRNQAYATCLVAFTEVYLTPESEWDSTVLNRVMTEGNLHYKRSLLAVQQSGAEDVHEINENQISTTIAVCRNNFDLELFQPFIFGQLLSKDPTVPNFHYGCKRYFRKNNYCFLSVAGLYFLIWKRHGLYFIFDPNGRNTSLKRDFQKGFVVLLALRSFENVNCYITSLSALRPNELYTIRRIKVTFLLPFIPPNTIYKRIRKTEYDIVDNQHAVLRGHLHLDMALFAEYHGKLFHVAAMIALLLSKIDQPSTWDSYIIDEILMLAKMKYSLWTKQNGKELKVQDIPTNINLGVYKVRVKFLSCEMCGTWSYVPNYRFSKLTTALKKIFMDSSNVIVEIGGRFYPLWKRNRFYYILDAYQHGCSIGPAVVHMASTPNMLCCIFHYNVLELLTPTDFAIHKVIIMEIIRRSPHEVCLDQLISVYEPKAKETVSLNESIEDIQWTLELKGDEFYCQEEFQDLDSPGISATQMVPDYTTLKNAVDTEGAEIGLDGEGEGDNESGFGGAGHGGGAGGADHGGGAGGGKDGKGGSGGKDDSGKDGGGKDGSGKDGGGKDGGGKDGGDGAGKDGKGDGRDGKGDGKDGKGDGKDGKAGGKDGKDGGKDGDKDGGKDGKSGAKDGKGKEGADGKAGLGKNGKDKDGLGKDGRGGKGDGDGDGGRYGTGGDGREGAAADGKWGKSGRRGGEWGSDGDDDGEGRKCAGSLANSYPGYTCIPHNMAVVGSQSGSPESINNLLTTGLKISDRVLLMTPWGNYIVFEFRRNYLLYDGCTCNINRFRHIDLTKGTAGLICHPSLEALIEQIISGNNDECDDESDHSQLIRDILCKYGN